MKIEDDLKLHSHYIEELFEANTALKERSYSMNEKVSLHSYILNEIDRNMLKVVKNQKELSERINEVRFDSDHRKSNFTFIKEMFDKPRNWITLCVIIFIIEYANKLPITDILKYMMGLF